MAGLTTIRGPTPSSLVGTMPNYLVSFFCLFGKALRPPQGTPSLLLPLPTGTTKIASDRMPGANQLQLAEESMVGHDHGHENGNEHKQGRARSKSKNKRRI